MIDQYYGESLPTGGQYLTIYNIPLRLSISQVPTEHWFTDSANTVLHDISSPYIFEFTEGDGWSAPIEESIYIYDTNINSEADLDHLTITIDESTINENLWSEVTLGDPTIHSINHVIRVPVYFAVINQNVYTTNPELIKITAVDEDATYTKEVNLQVDILQILDEVLYTPDSILEFNVPYGQGTIEIFLPCQSMGDPPNHHLLAKLF